ncbi:universal stress protein A-like protein [Asparagus officinalis]|uniref:universal stress protein A-like protein n=1 Tax=Asparagus officinalis TaxID=4686 RepID=UPI00098E4EE8|nr:universal stress protein A-like protein [Asparagus officinalis]
MEEEPAEIRMMMAEESKLTGEGKKMKVMVAVDGSEVGMHALTWTLDNLNVMMQPVGPAVYATPSVRDSVKKAQDQNSAIVISKAVQLCKERLVEPETMLLEGDPKDVICQAAEEMHADLLVVGSRGLSMLRRAFLGSVSDYVAHHANCPVLISKPPKSHSKHETAAREATGAA